MFSKCMHLFVYFIGFKFKFYWHSFYDKPHCNNQDNCWYKINFKNRETPFCCTVIEICKYYSIKCTVDSFECASSLSR